MSKIAEFEQRIIENGFTEEDLKEYEKLLKRVRDNFLKRQHCYSTAMQFPVEYTEQAVFLIKFGLEKFEDDGWFSTYTSYFNIGRIYEKAKEYHKAFDYYLLAKNALGDEHPQYVTELSKYLLWMKLHIDAFGYSTEMEEYYSNYTQAPEFSKAFLNSEIRLSIANIVVSLHYGKTEEAKKSLEIAKEICKPNYKGRLHNILNRHKCNETLNITPEAITFINNLKI